jgi:hypothetical protein
MAAIKDEICPALARSLAAELHGAWPELSTQRFTGGLAAELAPRELLARAEPLAEDLPPACGCQDRQLAVARVPTDLVQQGRLAKSRVRPE